MPHSTLELFDRVCQVLQAGHRQGNDTPEQTLNRLFRKHLNAHQEAIADDPPWLSSRNVAVLIEDRSTADLKALAPQPRNRPPRHTAYPVVIVRYRGRECLIDGGKRIHSWDASGNSEDHPAYVLAVQYNDEVS
jgi:hypothetical protein